MADFKSFPDGTFKEHGIDVTENEMLKLDYKGYEVVFFEGFEKWSCSAISKRHTSLSKLKEYIDKHIKREGGKRMDRTHELKTDPDAFKAVFCGKKTYEIRCNDRDFKCGDMLLLKETKYTGAEMSLGLPLIYTGREKFVQISHILIGPVYGLKDGWAILSIK